MILHTPSVEITNTVWKGLYVKVNYWTLACVLSLSCNLAYCAELTADQKEQVKLKSAKWAQANQKADALANAKKTAEAEEIYKTILSERKQLNLDLLPAYDKLANFYMTHSRNSDAEHAYKEMLLDREKRSEGNDLDLIFPLNQYAYFLDKIGKKNEAKVLHDRVHAIQKEADSLPTFAKITAPLGSAERVAEADKMRMTAEKYLASNQEKKALAYFNRAIELNPLDAKAYCGRGEAQTWFNESVKALADFNKAIALKPDLEKAFVNRAHLYSGMNKNAQALADFEKAISLSPSDDDAMGYRAKLLDVMGRHKEAVQAYSKIIELKPDLYWPYIQRAVANVSLNQYKNAIDDYTVLVKRAPEDPDFYEFRGEVYFKAGEMQNALSDYNKLIQLSPKYLTGYKQRAKVYEKLDGKKSARVLADLAMVKKLGG